MDEIVKLLNEAMQSGAMLFWHSIGDFERKYYAKNHWRLTIDNLWYTDDQYSIYDYTDRDICGKDGGFIKWLVDNEKIDYWTRNPLCITELAGEKEKQIPYSFYEEMLIRLAISDTPIEDLISMLATEYKTYMCRYYDDGHKDNEVLWEFKILKKVYSEPYNWEWIAKRKDGVIWSLKESEVSWMYNPKNWWSRMSFDARWTKEEILSLLD